MYLWILLSLLYMYDIDLEKKRNQLKMIRLNHLIGVKIYLMIKSDFKHTYKYTTKIKSISYSFHRDILYIVCSEATT